MLKLFYDNKKCYRLVQKHILCAGLPHTTTLCRSTHWHRRIHSRVTVDKCDRTVHRTLAQHTWKRHKSDSFIVSSKTTFIGRNLQKFGYNYTHICITHKIKLPTYGKVVISIVGSDTGILHNARESRRNFNLSVQGTSYVN